jgi:hypothetical protein
MADLADAPDLFKLIVTAQPKGSIPASVWRSSYVIFVDELAHWQRVQELHS